MACGLSAIPVRVASFDSDLDEQVAILDHNRQRVKTVSQRMREAELIERIERERAKERQREAGRVYGEKHPKQEVTPTLAEPLKGETRDAVAEAVGMKRSTYAKAKAVPLPAHSKSKSTKTRERTPRNMAEQMGKQVQNTTKCDDTMGSF